MNAILMVAMGAVTLVLVLGLLNMLKGGSASRSQMLMRWRVVLQLLAVVLAMFALWWARR